MKPVVFYAITLCHMTVQLCVYIHVHGCVENSCYLSYGDVN